MMHTKKALVTLAIAGAAALGATGSALAASSHEGPARSATTHAKNIVTVASPLDESLPAPMPN